MKLKRKLKFCWKLTSVGITTTTTTAQKYRLAANKLTTCVFLLLLFCHTLFRTHTQTHNFLPTRTGNLNSVLHTLRGAFSSYLQKFMQQFCINISRHACRPYTHTHTWKAILKRRLTWSRNWFNISKRLSEGGRERWSVRGKKQRTSKLKANRISWQLLMKAACKATKRVAHTQPCRCPPLHLPPTPPAGATHSGIL